MSRIAIVGLACQYPDAASPEQLWTNVLAGRRAFRRLPDERMRLADYWSSDPSTPDRFYSRWAAVIEGYEFDRVGFRVAGSTYRSTDLTHWLALDVATRALRDAGFPGGDELPRERTGVVVGNSLTGEFARANLMRLRWPYVQRLLAAALREQGWDGDQTSRFLTDLERRYKSPFPPIDEDTLAGGLANTIAGRICNYFDLKGGGYTVDGACSSSLLSVATACRSLREQELDVAIAGGVDLSIDPFEIVGFAKTGALASGEMLVYDRKSSGFWPGEGSGMVVLMRESDARAQDRRIYATIAGWGVSSDGKGGITRPEIAGYRLAVRRAYRRAGFGVDTVGLFEGHGTGTPVGNETELKALSMARREADPDAPPAAIGSIKAMIGHTKAAAGVAGLIKATMAVHHEVLPPTVGCADPHPVLCEERPALRVLPVAEEWPSQEPVRAAVMAMGFGGINTHVVLEAADGRRSGSLPKRVASLSRLAAGDGAQLLVLDGESPDQLRDRVAELADYVGRLSYAEIGDLAVTLQRQTPGGTFRAAVVAGTPEEAEQRLRLLTEILAEPPARLLEPEEGIFVGNVDKEPRIGFLFPGQGSGNQLLGGALSRRFPQAERVFAEAALPADGDLVATAVAQPRIAAGSLAGLAVLDELGIEATVATGHSLGELSALHWAGSFDASALLRIAEVRGRVMTEHSQPGTMASINGSAESVEPLLSGTHAVIAGYNGPRQTVVAGPAAAVEEVCGRAAAAGLGWVLLPVSHAFHSPLVARSAEALAQHLATEQMAAPSRPVMSTVTGEPLTPETDLVALLERQITAPVRFSQAAAAVAEETDLLLEVGPGAVLSRLAASAGTTPAISIDTDSPSLRPLLTAVAAAYVAGAQVRFDALLEGTLERPLVIGSELKFFASPCESAPEELVEAAAGSAGSQRGVDDGSAGLGTDDGAADTITLVRELVAARAELPSEAVQEDSRLLDDLHLSSITVGQVFVQAAQRLGLPAGHAPTSFATSTLKEFAVALDELRATGRDSDLQEPDLVVGVDSWVSPFAIEMAPTPEPPARGSEPDGPWRVFAPENHPLAEPLRRALERGGVGGGVVACMPSDCEEADLELALLAAKEAIAQPESRLVILQHGRGAAAIAKTARLEAPHVRTTLVDCQPVPEAVERVVADVAATTGYREVYYDATGERRTPVLRPVVPRPGASPLGSSDVLLVTGGGKGITAECAIALATDGGTGLAILGRSHPDSDKELAENLERMREAGLAVTYLQADVTDAEAVRSAVADIAKTLGPVTAILHGAGRNQPAALPNLDMDSFRQTLAPKLDGLEAVLDAVDPGTLQLVITFGSIIGRAGLRGEGHYATANDWLAHATVAVNERHPRCRAICLEWSVWSGVGMGERLSVIQSLVREGITPITVDRGLEVLRQVVADPSLPPVLVITGRAEGIDTVSYDRQPLPLLRFLEKPLVHYPGLELIVESRLTAGGDPYLEDHLLDGNLLFPAVLGLEAMTQVATALTGAETPLVFEEVELLRPIVAPKEGGATIRVAALATPPGTVTAVIRSGDTQFGVDHFRAVLRFDNKEADRGQPPQPAAGELPPLQLDPHEQLYGDLLFQAGRFRRLVRYRQVAARHAEADVALRSDEWFGGYLPSRLVLGDPGARDALMHGLQVCVPNATLLPAAIRRLWVDTKALPASECSFTAVERSNDGDTYTYDIAVRDPDGRLIEQWEGLRLQAVRKTDYSRSGPVCLAGPLVERGLADMLGVSVRIALEPDGDLAGRDKTALMVRRLLNLDDDVRYRPNGRPNQIDGHAVSASHAAGVTMIAAARFPVGCDVEPVVGRPAAEWSKLLQPHGPLTTLLAGPDQAARDVAGTRIWCALEALQKTGELREVPLTVDTDRGDGWVTFRAGATRVATLATSVNECDERLVIAVAVREES